jgi:hypothetical protein
VLSCWIQVAATPQEDTMKVNPMDRTLRGIGIAAIIFGLLGAVFYWWLPMGIMFSLTGLTLAFVDCVSSFRRSIDFRVSIAGLLISAAALTLCIVIAALGLQTVTFGW